MAIQSLPEDITSSREVTFISVDVGHIAGEDDKESQSGSGNLKSTAACHSA